MIDDADRDARDVIQLLAGGSTFFLAGEEPERQFRDVSEHVRKAVALAGHRTPSVAVVDRTSLWRTTQLLAGERGSADPFIALADLATVLGAAIFDDRIVVLGDNETAGIAASANELLGLDNAIRLISSSADPDGQPADIILSFLAEQLMARAIEDLQTAASENADWIEWLEENWKQLLPGLTDFPSYARLYDVIDKYKESSYDVYDLFNITGEAWRFSFEDPGELVLDNDLRAMFYERVVDCLRTFLTEADMGPSVHYAGGCLRTPLMLARARRLETAYGTSISPTGMLQEMWSRFDAARAAASGVSSPIVLPFWADAIISRCKRPDDFRRVVPHYRAKAAAFRRRRRDIDLAIQEGNRKELEKLMHALRGDASGLVESVIKEGGQVAEKAVPVFTGLPIPGFGSAAGIAGKMLPRYLFRPHLQLLFNLGKDAGCLTRPLRRTLEIFKYPDAGAADPGKFLDQLGRIAWLT